MKVLIDLWIGLPHVTQMGLLMIVVKLVADGIRYAVKSKKIDGRWVHLLAGVFAFSLTVVDAMVSGGAGGDITVLVRDSLVTMLGAIGLNEATRGPGKLGPDADETLPR
jgi:hypothetical protein